MTASPKNIIWIKLFVSVLFFLSSDKTFSQSNDRDKFNELVLAVGLLPAHIAYTQDAPAAYSFFVEHQRG